MNSILTSIKKLLGIDGAYTHFDDDLIMHINSVFSTLNQIGVGPTNGFAITGAQETWSNYSTDINEINLIKIYAYFKVRMAFDPPSGSSVAEATNKSIAELEWRIHNIIDLREG